LYEAVYRAPRMPETHPYLSFPLPINCEIGKINQKGGPAVYALSHSAEKKANASRRIRFALPFLAMPEFNASDKTTFTDQIKGCLDFWWCNTSISWGTWRDDRRLWKAIEVYGYVVCPLKAPDSMSSSRALSGYTSDFDKYSDFLQALYNAVCLLEIVCRV
jgi:hypothetical protein